MPRTSPFEVSSISPYTVEFAKRKTLSAEQIEALLEVMKHLAECSTYKLGQSKFAEKCDELHGRIGEAITRAVEDNNEES